MDYKSKYEREQRLNKTLKEELGKVKLENDELINKCMEPDIEQSELIETLKQINQRWEQAVAEVEAKNKEYEQLLQEMREFRNKMMGSTRLQRRVDKLLP
jgi:glutamine synthetase adenylyltransferase